jgi:hypothetical protein
MEQFNAFKALKNPAHSRFVSGDARLDWERFAGFVVNVDASVVQPDDKSASTGP